MPLTISNIPISKLSGPLNFAILVPKQEILEKLNRTHLPVIMLLGDLHEDIDINKMCQEHKEELATFVPFWFRLLDTLASKGCSVDYFIDTIV